MLALAQPASGLPRTWVLAERELSRTVSRPQPGKPEFCTANVEGVVFFLWAGY